MELLGQHADALIHLVGWTLALGGVAILATLRATDDRLDPAAALRRAVRRAIAAVPTAPMEIGGNPWPDDDRSLRRRRDMELLLSSARTSRAPPGPRLSCHPRRVDDFDSRPPRVMR